MFLRNRVYFGLCKNLFSVIQMTAFSSQDSYIVSDAQDICGFVLSFMFYSFIDTQLLRIHSAALISCVYL